MSATASVLSACPNLQVPVGLAFNKYASQLEALPQLEFLNSDVNTQNITDFAYRGNGKTRDVDVTYFKRFTESEVLENQPNPVCSGGETDPDTTATYTIDTSENVQELRSFGIQDLERYCSDNGMYLGELIARMADAVERKTATKTATQSAALVGNWASDVTVDANQNLVVQTLQSGGILLNSQFLRKIRLGLVKTNYVGGAVAFADTLLYEGYMDAQVGCCSDSGIDVSQALQSYGIATMWDRRVETAMANSSQGANTSMILQPGSLALLYHTRSGWKNGMERRWVDGGSSYIFTTITGRAGTPMDVTVTDNCGTITIAVTATTKVVGLPTDMYKSGDTFEGVVGVNSVKVTNP